MTIKRLYILSVGEPSASKTGPKPKKEIKRYKKMKKIVMMILVTKLISFQNNI